MKKYLFDAGVGLILGFIYFFGSIFFDAAFIGTDFFLTVEFGGTKGWLLLGLFTIILGIVPFSIYFYLPVYEKFHLARNFKLFLLSFLLFSVGVSFAYLLFLLLAVISISQWSGPSL